MLNTIGVMAGGQVSGGGGSVRPPGGPASFARLVLLIFLVLMAGLFLLRFCGADDGSLPFDYEGMG